MAKVKITAAVTLQEQLAADIYDMRIKAPEIAHRNSSHRSAACCCACQTNGKCLWRYRC